jgi:hypothetical protein
MKTIKNYISKFWTQVFNDAPFINELIDATMLMNNGLDISLAEMNSDLNRRTMSVYRKKQWLFVTYKETDLNTDIMEFNQTEVFFNGEYQFGSRGAEFRFALPIDPSIKRAPFILSSPFNASVVLQDGIDYTVDSRRGFIFFKENPFEMSFEKRFVDTVASPVMGIGIWLYNLDEDAKDLQNIYADPVKVAVKTNDYFKRIVNVIWDLRIEGGSICNVTELVCALTDCDLPREEEIVTKIFTEGGRNWIATATHVYSAPAAAEVLYAVGDTLKVCQPAFDAVKVYTGLEDIPESEFPAMHLGESFVGTDFPGGIMIENKDFPFPGKKVLIYDQDGHCLVEDIADLAYIYWVDKVRGYIIDLLVDDASVNYTLVDAYWDLPFFGQPLTVEAFKNYLVSVGAEKNIDGLAEICIANNGGLVPPTINLFKEYQSNIFRNNAFFLVINTNLIPSGVDPSLFLTYIKYTIPAYTTMLTFLGSESTVSYVTSNISEQVDVFYVADVSDTYDAANISTRTDRKDSY